MEVARVAAPKQHAAATEVGAERFFLEQEERAPGLFEGSSPPPRGAETLAPEPPRLVLTPAMERGKDTNQQVEDPSPESSSADSPVPGSSSAAPPRASQAAPQKVEPPAEEASGGRQRLVPIRMKLPVFMMRRRSRM